MKPLHLFIGFVFLTSCKNRVFRAPSGSMEATIMTGETFYVQPSNTFERNDIVVFDHFGPVYTFHLRDDPGKFPLRWNKKVYRLIAYSGDSLEIKDGEVYINSRHIALPPKAIMPYEVLSTVRIEEFEQRDPYDITITNTGDTLRYTLNLTTDQALSYREKRPAIISVKKSPPNIPLDD